MPSICFDEADDMSVTSKLSDVEMEQVRKEIKRIATIQMTDMVALDDKFIAMIMVAELEERDKEDNKRDESAGHRKHNMFLSN
jgi:hypothetical protein